MAATPNDAIRAYTIASTVFDLPGVWRQVAAMNNRAPALTQDTSSCGRAGCWTGPLAGCSPSAPSRWTCGPRSSGTRGRSSRLTPQLPILVSGEDMRSVQAEIAELTEAGAPRGLAETVAFGLHTYSLLDAVDVAADSGRDLLECAELLYALSAHLDFDHLLTAVTALERGDRWHALARQALRDDLYRSLRRLTADVLSTTSRRPGCPGQDRAVGEAEQVPAGPGPADARRDRRVSVTDLAELSVAAREIRSMIR